MRKALAIILMLTMVLTLAACGGSPANETIPPEVTEAPTAAPEPTAGLTPEPMQEPEDVQSDSDETEEQPAGTLSREVCDIMADGTISSTFGENYVIDSKDNTIVIVAWDDSLTMTANSAKNNGGEGVEADSWNRLVSSLTDLCQTLHETYVKNGHEVDVHFLLANDDSATQILLTIKNDEVLTNIVNK